MFEIKKSDFGVIIGGYALISFIMMMATVVYSIYYMDFSSTTIKGFLIFSDMSGNMMMFIPLVICATLGILAGCAAVLKGYVSEGMLFVATSLVLITVGGSPFAFAFAIIYGLIALMAFREGNTDTMVLSILLGGVSFINYFYVFSTGSIIVLILAVLSLVVTVLSIYLTYVKWNCAQEYIGAFGDYPFDACGCGCCDGECDECEECADCCGCEVEDCECVCHQGEDCDKDDCTCRCHEGDCRKK